MVKTNKHQMKKH